MLQWQEKGSHGKKCPSGQRATDHPFSQRNRWRHVHDKRIADATPYPLPAGSRLLQDLGFVAFTLPEVEILMPMKKPRGQSLTLDQQRVNRSLNERRLRIEHVNSSVKRCRIVKDRIRLWKQGIRDLVMEICCALHNFRVRLGPWQPMI
jgi:DDE superfamily endonuclease